MKKESATYLLHAEVAATLERQKLYQDAVIHWRHAANNAKTVTNRHWAESRTDFCATYPLKEQQPTSKAA